MNTRACGPVITVTSLQALQLSRAKNHQPRLRLTAAATPSAHDVHRADGVAGCTEHIAIFRGTAAMRRGGTWSTVSLPVSGVLHGLGAVSANDVWAVGNGGLILNWNGTRWSQVSNPSGQDAGLAAVAAFSANDAWLSAETAR
jgi:hypothetical protein